MNPRPQRVAFLWFLLIAAAAVPALTAQDSKHQAQLKTVHGQVLDKEENPVPSGVVFLKNVRTNQVRSYIADPQGSYRFSGLDPNTDYELHAEKDGAKSQTRNVSSFDTRLDIAVNLKLERKKG